MIIKCVDEREREDNEQLGKWEMVPQTASLEKSKAADEQMESVGGRKEGQI